MSGLRSSSAHVTRRGRKKGSSRKRDASLTNGNTRRGSLGGAIDRYHRTLFPLVMDLSHSDEEPSTGHSPMEIGQPANNNSTSSDSYFFFQLLPLICKHKIWSFLQQCDLGRSMLVCKEWFLAIQQSPKLWSCIRFSDLPYSCLPRDKAGPLHTKPICHHCFKKRVYSFSDFLTLIGPEVKEFQFCLDVSHPQDQFLKVVEQFMYKSVLSKLRSADINWKESPSRFPIRSIQENHQDFVYRFRRRQRMFVTLFDSFTQMVPNLTTLVVPFDWSERSINSLCRLQQLQVLVLERYGVYSQYYSQEKVDQIMKSLLQLRKFLPELWLQTVSGQNLESPSLVYLDLSQCRGYHIRKMVTPCLQSLRITRRPWNSNLILQTEQPAVLPCLWSVLARGAPNLKEINDFKLDRNWMARISRELNSVLSTVCYCQRHRESSGIAMYGM